MSRVEKLLVVKRRMLHIGKVLILFLLKLSLFNTNAASTTRMDGTLNVTSSGIVINQTANWSELMNKNANNYRNTLKPDEMLTWPHLSSAFALPKQTANVTQWKEVESMQYTSGNKGSNFRILRGRLSYVGEIQVRSSKGHWGYVCADGWDINDARVVCRQFGWSLGWVISSRTLAKRFQGLQRSLKIAIANVSCNGSEKSLEDCQYETWDAKSDKLCHLKPAGVLCGCQIPPSFSDVITRCWASKYPWSKMYCRHSCPTGQTLSGSSLQHCDTSRKWTGITPRCLEDTDPCLANPCQNNGVCIPSQLSKTKYECVCQPQFRGLHCQNRTSWTCGKPRTSPGKRSSQPTLKIVGGRVAKLTSWPWIVQLRDNESTFCAGTLISPQWIITAAHCLITKNIPNGHNNDSRWTVVVGQLEREENLHRSSNVFQVLFFVSHEYTNEDIPRKDVALIRLTVAPKLTDVVHPICLPSSSQQSPAPGTKCWIAGWGSYTLSSELPQFLQQGSVPIMSQDTCRKLNDGDNDYSNVSANMICAGYLSGGVDACKGDSGGPLVCSGKDQFYLAGVTSWGYGCAERNTPGVYTRVSHYLDWMYKYILL